MKHRWWAYSIESLVLIKILLHISSNKDDVPQIYVTSIKLSWYTSNGELFSLGKICLVNQTFNHTCLWLCFFVKSHRCIGWIFTWNCLNMKELLARNKCNNWKLCNCNRIQTDNHLVLKQTLNHYLSPLLSLAHVYVHVIVYVDNILSPNGRNTFMWV